MDFTKLGQAAAESDNQSEERATTRELPRAGVALMRLREYIELGRHAPKNPQHKVAFKTLLVFELLHPDHMYDTDDGKKPMVLTVRVNKTATSKGRFLPLFRKMNYDGKAEHMIQMIGKSFLGTLTHNVDGDKTYVNLDGEDGAWNIGAPTQVDVIAGTSTEIPVPELVGKPRAFLWEPESEHITDEDIKGMWDMIHIEGTREVDKKEVSKNWIQETIQANVEWEGSRTQSLTEEQIDIDELSVDPAGAVDETPAI